MRAEGTPKFNVKDFQKKCVWLLIFLHHSNQSKKPTSNQSCSKRISISHSSLLTFAFPCLFLSLSLYFSLGATCTSFPPFNVCLTFHGCLVDWLATVSIRIWLAETRKGGFLFKIYLLRVTGIFHFQFAFYPFTVHPLTL